MSPCLFRYIVYRHTCKQNPIHIKNILHDVQSFSNLASPLRYVKMLIRRGPLKLLIFKALFYFPPSLLFPNHPPNRCMWMLLTCVPGLPLTEQLLLSGPLLSTYSNNPGKSLLLPYRGLVRATTWLKVKQAPVPTDLDLSCNTIHPAETVYSTADKVSPKGRESNHSVLVTCCYPGVHAAPDTPATPMHALPWHLSIPSWREA